MKPLRPILCLFVIALTRTVAADDTAERNKLLQVAEEIKARRGLRTLGTEDIEKLVFVKHEQGIEFTAKDRLLFECREGFARLLDKEILMTRAVASKRLTLETKVIPPSKAREQLFKKLDEAGVVGVELGDTTLVFVVKSQLPK